MNFYKFTDYFLINLDLVTHISIINGDWFVFFVNDTKKLITHDDAIEIKKILFSKSEGKQVMKVKTVCDRCGGTFLCNVLFDKNGVSINTIEKLCSKCIVDVKKEVNEVKE